MKGPVLPTYRTAAAVLEGNNGSGLRLLGWTVARMILIAPPMLVVGVPPKQAFWGSAIASGLISSLTLLRIFNAGQNGVEPVAGLKGRGRPRRAFARR